MFFATENKTKISMMQPSFMPWQGLFELIYYSDKFIFLDDFQFVVQSHHTRNKLFINNDKVGYYCVPVQKSRCFQMKLNEVMLVENIQWKKKLLRTIEYNYKKTPFFNQIYSMLSDVLNENHKTLASLNIALIIKICNLLGIQKDFLYSSNFTKDTSSTAKRSARVIELLKWAEADTYISAFGSYDYMKEDKFDFKKYNVVFQNFHPKKYNQLQSSTFIPYLSIIDSLFNVGKDETLNLVKHGTDTWLNWQERGEINV